MTLKTMARTESFSLQNIASNMIPLQKTILFFTHFGQHSVMEAIHFAVPMVGFPIFVEQG